MFPLRTGRPVNAPSTESVLYQSLTAAAMHEIGKRAIIDTAILVFHQFAADIYYKEEEGIEIEENPDGSYKLYTPEEEKKLRKQLANVAMRYHIVDENGCVTKLTPLIDYLKDGVPLEPEYENDPFIKAILNNSKEYRADLFNRKIIDTIDKIRNFDNVHDEITDEMVLDSYKNPNEPLEIAVFEDDTVQCVCDFCEGIFQVLDKEVNVENMNPIQQIMAKNFLDDDESDESESA